MDDVDDLLDYEKEIFLNLHHESGLLVCSRGLCIERIFYYFVKLYSDPQCLVLVINSNPDEAQFLIDRMKKETYVSIAPRLLTADISINERMKIYRDGGVVFVSSRILVVDLLSDRVPVALVTGILLLRAHLTLETCQEAFILRLYRERNSTGFVKAFTEQPSALISGFNHVHRLMISCQARHLHLWPRFHASVVSTLEARQPIVEEIRISLTPAMVACQRALLDLIHACLKELAQINSSLDLEELTVENALTRGFDKLIRRYLDPVWHRLNGQSQQIVSDINTLRRLTWNLTHHDAVTFFSIVNSLSTSKKVFGQNAGWLFYDEANLLFTNARSRVKGSKSKKDEETDSNGSVEEFPKWTALRQVLEEIEKSESCLQSVLIIIEDEKTARVVNDLIEHGSDFVINMLKARYMRERSEKVFKPSTKKAEREPKKKEQAGQPTLTQMLEPKPHDEEGKEEEAETVSTKGLTFHYLRSSGTHRSPGEKLPHVLSTLKPKHVILYDPDMAAVRQIEVFQAGQDFQLTVHFFLFSDSVEEQRYLTTLRKEKESFEFLIAEKSSLVLPEDLLNAWDGEEEQSMTGSTRKAGGALLSSAEQPRVVVDMREFRSSLPSLIHRRGMKVIPQTIEIGDYILSPEICVERKSVNDLIGSLNSGRMLNQCVAMTRSYKRPTLLIEFDSSKAFSLYSGVHRQAKLSTEFSSHDVMSKLVLLTMHFPTLRIIWTPNPYATAEMFMELKQGRPEPTVSSEASAALDEATKDALDASRWESCRARDMLLRLPGVTERNYRALLRHANCLQEVCNLTQEELKLIFENEAQARMLHNFLHEDRQKEVEEMQKANAGGKQRATARGGYRRFRMNLAKK